MKLTERQTAVLRFVTAHHGNQKRKYTGEPYWHHPLAVAEIISEHEPKGLGIEIALCHDLFEDTECGVSDLSEFLIANGYTSSEMYTIGVCVIDLTDKYTHEDYPELNREVRKSKEVERLARINYLSQSVKYADLIDNTKSIVEHDKGFAKVYLQEKKYLLEKMTMGNPSLLEMCQAQIS